MGKCIIDESVQSMTRTFGIVEDVVCVVESVRYDGVDERDVGGGGERRVLKGVVDGSESRVRRGSLV